MAKKVKKKMPLVSVIIPCKNSSRTIRRCLKSIKDQSYSNVEIIVVDNNSTDNTKEIAKKYTKLVFNKGPERSAQRNFGARKAKGEFLLIHDSDIYFDKDSVAECVELTNKTKCEAIILPEKSVGEGYWTKVKAFERSFYTENDLIEASRFFDKKTFLDIGGYDEELTACEDWDFQNRLDTSGCKTERTKIYLLHDEGRINVFGSSKKKSYYSKWIRMYKKKYPERSKEQFKFFSRFTPRKILTKGVPHPILFVSMILMKFIEWRSTR